jgi:hypothetical protein
MHCMHGESEVHSFTVKLDIGHDQYNGFLDNGRLITPNSLCQGVAQCRPSTSSAHASADMQKRKRRIDTPPIIPLAFQAQLHIWSELSCRTVSHWKHLLICQIFTTKEHYSEPRHNGQTGISQLSLARETYRWELIILKRVVMNGNI